MLTGPHREVAGALVFALPECDAAQREVSEGQASSSAAAVAAAIASSLLLRVASRSSRQNANRESP
jgi:hypothetical protein